VGNDEDERPQRTQTQKNWEDVLCVPDRLEAPALRMASEGDLVSTSAAKSPRFRMIREPSSSAACSTPRGRTRAARSRPRARWLGWPYSDTSA
jgi:hypothetical protein